MKLSKAIDNKEEIGKRIKEARIKKGLTQSQLGEIIGIKEIGIRQYEIGRNKPREDRLREIANALDTDYLYLLVGEDSTQRNATGLSIQNRIRKAMKDKGFTVKKLAKEANISEKGINDFLNGITDISDNILRRIAHTLSVNYRWLCLGYDLSDEKLLKQYIDITNNENFKYEDIYEIGKLLQEEMEFAGMYGDQIANILGINQHLLFQFMEGKEVIDYKTLCNISSILHIDARSLACLNRNGLSRRHINKIIETIDYLQKHGNENGLREIYDYLIEALKK